MDWVWCVNVIENVNDILVLLYNSIPQRIPMSFINFYRTIYEYAMHIAFIVYANLLNLISIDETALFKIILIY